MKKLTNPKLLNPLLGVLGLASCTVIASPIITNNAYDLTRINRYAVINNAIFATPDNDTTVGTGVFDPFVRIQAQNGNDTVENGYNTDGRPVEFDTKDQNRWTHSLLLSTVSTKDVNGTLYREFFLDINESSGQGEQYLSLDDFRIFLGSVGDLDNYNLTTNTLSYANGTHTATKVYDLDTSTTNNTIGLDYSNFSGSGKGIDLTVLVPDSVFTGANNQQYVYLYSSFGGVGNIVGNSSKKNNSPPPSLGPLPGAQVSPGALPAGNYGASAGFEEWSSRSFLAVPEPATYWLLGIGMAGLLGLRRLRAYP
ncbi:MAG: PEP-CTERM sorting domain-containing protein [Gammaproteobacteria bacterium]|nr:PEP-CTERM sorting domain-containing protein [Gammaproteobacteria bacterium]